MGMVILEHFSHDAGALIKWPIVHEAFPQHRVQNTPLHRFEAITSIGQGARDDDRHRVLDVSRLHNVGNVSGGEFFVSGIHRKK